MKTSDIEIRDLLSVLSVVGVENRIGEVPGVESVTVNHAAGLATVRYDETRLDAAEIRSAVRQGEYEPAGSADTPSEGAHDGHKAPPAATPKPGAPPAAPVAAKPTPVVAPAATGAPAPATGAAHGDDKPMIDKG